MANKINYITLGSLVGFMFTLGCLAITQYLFMTMYFGGYSLTLYNNRFGEADSEFIMLMLFNISIIPMFVWTYFKQFNFSLPKLLGFING